jgi:hypothetical protein
MLLWFWIAALAKGPELLQQLLMLLKKRIVHQLRNRTVPFVANANVGDKFWRL